MNTVKQIFAKCTNKLNKKDGMPRVTSLPALTIHSGGSTSLMTADSMMSPTFSTQGSSLGDEGSSRNGSNCGSSEEFGAASASGSTTMAVSEACPETMMRKEWSIKDFLPRRILHKGDISTVYEAVDILTKTTVALKVYYRPKLSHMERIQISREIHLHAALVHDSIIAMYAAWKDRSRVYLVLEWAPGGDLHQYMRRRGGWLPEGDAVSLVLRPFMEAIHLLHIRGLIHRDIKPENILMTSSRCVKIADFGLSIDSMRERSNTRLGTIEYLAPEILLCPSKVNPFEHKDNPNIGYTYKVDCWAVGILAYELLVGATPYAADSPGETMSLIGTQDVGYPDFLSPGAVDFMKKVLLRDPQRRADMSELLEHPWIIQHAGFLTPKRAALSKLPADTPAAESRLDYAAKKAVPILASAAGLQPNCDTLCKSISMEIQPWMLPQSTAVADKAATANEPAAQAGCRLRHASV